MEANLAYLADTYGVEHACHAVAHDLVGLVDGRTIESIFDEGLHEFLDRCIASNNRLGSQIELDYRFNE